jgi:hypothetical protein
MNQETLARRRDRTHAIVEGALLGDIAIVFLLMRVFLPLPGVRTILRTFAAVPLVMLTQRRGVKLTILAAIASYILFSALVGPILAIAAIDVAVSGILLGIGRKFGWNPILNTLWTGVAYAFLDLVVPTIATVIIFRYPVKTLVAAARHFVRLIFNVLIWLMKSINLPHSAITTVNSWEGPAVNHWQYIWVATMIVYGLLTMYLVVLVVEIVLRQLPPNTLARQRAA